jgi:hypothetical protein
MADPHGAACLRPLSAAWAVSERNEIALFGGDELMPDVRHLIAECPRRNAPGQACGVYYADLQQRGE